MCVCVCVCLYTDAHARLYTGKEEHHVCDAGRLEQSSFASFMYNTRDLCITEVTNSAPYYDADRCLPAPMSHC